jgi:hypothetical protein
MKASDYIWIERWGKLLGSFDHYIKNQQEKALAENAPVAATFKRNDGTWALINNVSNLGTRAYFEQNFANCRIEGFWND